MREIKFRAWVKQENRMAEVLEVHQGGKQIKVYDSDGDGCYNYLQSKKYELMQYTGLKDKIGVEIYEGDIVKIGQFINHEEDETGWFGESIHTVEWCGPSYPAFDLIPHCDCECNGLQYYADIRTDDDAIEVIGNVYQNKELLTS